MNATPNLGRYGASLEAALPPSTAGRPACGVKGTLNRTLLVKVPLFYIIKPPKKVVVCNVPSYLETPVE